MAPPCVALSLTVTTITEHKERAAQHLPDKVCVWMEDEEMDEQKNDRTASRGQPRGNTGSSNEQMRSNYDVPIPRPKTDLGFRGIRRKRSGFDSQMTRRRDN